MDDLISRLSEIRSQYNLFNESEEPYYRALSEVIKMLSEQADGDTISRQAAIDVIEDFPHGGVWNVESMEDMADRIKALPPAQPDGYVKIPETGIDDMSDGFHTFRQLYYQRMMLFATIIKQNKNKAWKSLRHEDGELCFGGGWFIVGIDTPEGSYTYHYETNFYSLFDCEELECAKHWDGHTEKNVTRLLSLPSAQSEPCELCSNLEKGDTLYQWSDWDGGIGFDYIRDIRFCPKCGRSLE